MVATGHHRGTLTIRRTLFGEVEAGLSDATFEGGSVDLFALLTSTAAHII